MGSSIVFIWVASVYLCFSAVEMIKHDESPPSLADLATVLFGASSIALIVFSILIGVLAVFGWRDIQNTINQRVETATAKSLAVLNHEARGRIFTGLGYMLGELSSRPKSLAPDPSRASYVSRCVELCREGYEELKKVGGPAEMTGLNNFVYYSCFEADETQKGFLLEKARILRNYSQERFYFPRFLLTYIRVILQMGTDPEERRQALAIAAKLADAPIAKHEQDEARLYLASFPQPAVKP